MTFIQTNKSEEELRALWFEYQQAEGWFDAGSDPIDSARRIKELFGPPAYAFLRIGDPVPLTLPGSRRRLIQATNHGATNLQPSRARRVGQRAYSALPKSGGYEDGLGRLWFPRAESDPMVFDFKMPIKLKQQGVAFPENGEPIELIPRERGLSALSGTVDVTVIAPRASTGTVTLLNVQYTNAD